MDLTDYYKFERGQNQNNKNRLNCTTCTKSYFSFEQMRKNGKLWFYIGASHHVKANRHRKADLSVTSGAGNHITSIFPTDVNSGVAYGDVKGTMDLLIFVFTNFEMEADGRIKDGATVEVFVARGRKFEKEAIKNLFLDGELKAEMETLRKRATADENLK